MGYLKIKLNFFYNYGEIITIQLTSYLKFYKKPVNCPVNYFQFTVLVYCMCIIAVSVCTYVSECSLHTWSCVVVFDL